LGPGLYGPWCDFVYTHHRGQVSRGDGQSAHFEAGIRMYEDVIGTAMPRWARTLIRRDLAAWRTNYGRSLAATQNLRGARQQFARAIRTDPGFRSGWTQLAFSLLWPRRLAERD